MSNQSRAILPSSNQQKQILKKQIQIFIQKINENIQQQQRILSTHKKTNKEIEKLNQKLQILQRRLLLIDKCSQFSLHRLNHLQQIFKYYCTHIFKIGKHMTFDRLQYQKEHLNTQRFFLFLKDFNLTVMQVQGKMKQIISKQSIMTIFKKVSSNARDFTFQEFIKCLQKIAILYYDQKNNYWNKIQEQKLEKIKRKKEIQKRKIKRMKINGQKIDPKLLESVEKLNRQQSKISESNNNKNNDKLENQGDKQNEQQKQKQENNELQDQQNQDNGKITSKNNNNPKIQQNNNQNDQLIIQIMENKDIQDPNQQINQFTNLKRNQSIQHENKKKLQIQYQTKLLTLTNNQKIQYFYQLIGVDSVKQYKNKLTVLNMPVFKGKTSHNQNNKESSTSQNIIKSHKTIDQSQSLQRSQSKQSIQQQQRALKIKQKMNQKKQKLKNQPIPKPKQVKQSQTAKKRRQMKEERQLKAQQKLKDKHQDNQNINKKSTNNGKVDKKQNALASIKVSYNENQVNWESLQKMSLQHLKLRNFQPNKFYQQQEDDHIYLNQFGGGYKIPMTSRQQRIQAKQRQSLSIVQNMKKRVGEVQKNQKKQENKLLNKINQGRLSMKGKF